MRGIDKFKERFAGHDSEYVLIGGGACDLLFGEAGQDFRATKDLDLVLLVEALTPEFGRVFWDFVKEGGYENRQKSSGKPQFYRFSKPEDPAFPAMLELFARTDVDLRDAESGLMPIHIDTRYRRKRAGGTPAAGALPPRASSRSLLEEIGEHRIVFLVVVTVASALLIIVVGFRVGIIGGFAEIFARVPIET